MKKRDNDNVFLIVDRSHTFIDSDGTRYKHTAIGTTPLGHLSRKELSEYKQIIDNTNFRDCEYCMNKIETNFVISKYSSRAILELKLYPTPIYGKCGVSGINDGSGCPFAITIGECKHPLVRELIGRKFRPQMYENQR